MLRETQVSRALGDVGIVLWGTQVSAALGDTEIGRSGDAAIVLWRTQLSAALGDAAQALKDAATALCESNLQILS